MQKGFAPILILIALVIIIAGAGGAYYFGKLPVKPANQEPKACTQEAKLCPDGSSVGRTGPNCELAPCPYVSAEVSDETTNWQTYANTKYWFSIKYPTNLQVKEGRRTTYSLDTVVLELKNYLPKAEFPARISIEIYENPNNTDPITFLEKNISVVPDVPDKDRIQQVRLNDITAIRLPLPGPTDNDNVVFSRNGLVFIISLSHGFSADIKAEAFNQILSTFKFLDQNDGDSGIEGKIALGPTCPVQRADEGCPDRPYQGTVIVKSPDGIKEISRFTSDMYGKFRVVLPAGNYLLEPVSDRPFPIGKPENVTVEKGKFTVINLSYDSGIR